MGIELPKVYEPQEAEGRIYEKWEKAGCFRGIRYDVRTVYQVSAALC